MDGREVVALEVVPEVGEGVAATEANQLHSRGSAVARPDVEDGVARAEPALRHLDPMLPHGDVDVHGRGPSRCVAEIRDARLVTAVAGVDHAEGRVAETEAEIVSARAAARIGRTRAFLRCPSR